MKIIPAEHKDVWQAAGHDLVYDCGGIICSVLLYEAGEIVYNSVGVQRQRVCAGHATCFNVERDIHGYTEDSKDQ